MLSPFCKNNVYVLLHLRIPHTHLLAYLTDLLAYLQTF